jgi:TRAP-type C4-dicarboxylate transport system substrate-binding protein
MPDDYKKMFDEVALEAKEYAAGLMADSSTTNLKGLVDAGLEAIDFSEEEISKLKEKADVVKEMLKTDLGDDVVNTFMEALEKSKN